MILLVLRVIRVPWDLKVFKVLQAMLDLKVHPEFINVSMKMISNKTSLLQEDYSTKSKNPTLSLMIKIYKRNKNL